MSWQMSSERGRTVDTLGHSDLGRIRQSKNIWPLNSQLKKWKVRNEWKKKFKKRQAMVSFQLPKAT